MAFRSGFVSIIGRPNAGKSTLLNALVGEKVAIVSSKPQTTRTRIQGIVNLEARPGRPAAQIVFIDTPGVHRPDSRLNRRMLQEIHEALESRDLILLIVDAADVGFANLGSANRDAADLDAADLIAPKKFGTGDRHALDLVKKTGSPVFLLLNKIDKLPKDRLLPMIEHYRRLHEFAAIIPISAIKKDGLDRLLDQVVSALPEGPHYFPEDQFTDQPERFIASEIIREKILLKTAKELPYSTAVVIDSFEESERLTRIAATIYCEREGQKAILIGKGGQKLKEIGTAARLDLERLLSRKIFLELFVKVKPGWRESDAFVDELDWRRNR